MGFFTFSITGRRCIAVDFGQSRIKAILAERKGSRIEVLHAFTLDLQEEGLLTQEETNRHISRILLEMGDFPLSLVVPQHIAVSHLIALPGESKGRWEKLIEEETQKLTGLSESAIVYDYFRLTPVLRQRNPVWVTVAREKELEDQIGRLQESGLEITEVSNAGNALASAFIATQPPEKRVFLADIGATATTVVVLERMQPVYATAFPFGGEMFTAAIGRDFELDFGDAEITKKTEFLFGEHEPGREFIQAVERWRQELERGIFEWIRDQTEESDETLRVVVSGGSSLQPGFLEYLDSQSEFKYASWRDNVGGVDPQTYALAYGAALGGLKVAPVNISLLPRPLRIRRKRSRQVAIFNTIAFVLLLVLLGVFMADSSARKQVVQQKIERIENLEVALTKASEIDDLLQERRAEYNRIIPVVQQQQRTIDLLKTISIMQRVRAKHEKIWFVALADGRSYRRVSTIEQEAVLGLRSLPEADFSAAEAAQHGWNRFVVELSIPGEPKDVRETLRQVVELFRADGIYLNVDTLPAAARRKLVSENVTLPEQTFSLNLELIPSELPVPAIEAPQPSSTLFTQP